MYRPQTTNHIQIAVVFHSWEYVVHVKFISSGRPS